MIESQALTTPLATFLAQAQIEASPAWAWLGDRALQKPMPTLFHSRLQRNLVQWINQQSDRLEAIQELHCLRHETALAWLIDVERQQVWVWEGTELPNIYAQADRLPTLGDLAPLTVTALMAMTNGRSLER